MRALFVLIGLYFSIGSSARRFDKLKQVNFSENFLTVSRSTCGKVPRFKQHESGLPSETASFGEIPWQVGLFYEKDGSYLCCGTLISNEHVLTAAVCLISIEEKNSINVRLGDWDISAHDSPYEAYKDFRTTVRKVVLLEDQNSTAVNLATIALLFLKEKVDFSLYPHIAPICLPDVTNNDNSTGGKNYRKNCTVSGWGLQKSSGDEIPHDSPIFFTPDTSSDLETDNSFNQNMDSIPGLKLVDEGMQLSSRSLTSTKIQPQIGPLLISVPMFLSRREQELYYRGKVDYSGLVNENPKRDSDVAADDYSQLNPIEGIDPILNGDLGFPSVGFGNYFNFTSTTQDTSDDLNENATEASAHFASIHRSMFRHKEKYKSGKVSPWITGNSENNSSKSANGSNNDDNNVDVHKRNQPKILVEKTRTFPSYLYNVLDESVTQMMRPILKQANVTFQSPCLESQNPGENMEIGIGKSCIASPYRSEPASLCMVDLGSPVVCKEVLLHKKRRARSISYDSKSQDVKSQYKEKESVSEISLKKLRGDARTITRYALAGIVTWKRPCYENDDNLLEKYTVVTDTQAFLDILFQQLENN